MKLHLKKSFYILVFALLGVSCNKIPTTPNYLEAQKNIPPLPIADTTTKTTSGKPFQIVVMAFDGSYSPEMWQDTLDFSLKMTSSGTPVHFTYFISGTYFLNYKKSSLYHPPQKPPGTSMIGFGLSNNDIEKRVAFVNRAITEGHEIGSHLNGHFDGSSWSKSDWTQEFSEFNKLIFHIAENNQVPPNDAEKFKLHITPQEVVGFRAPNLGKNAALWPALKENGLLYDTSLVGKPQDWPKKIDLGLWEFPLANIQYATSTKYLLSMDYNFYFKQSGAKDSAKKGTANWNQFYKDTYLSYYNYFEKNYTKNRAPVFIGSHFSRWNDGVYWEAMRDFATTVCAKPEVKCIPFKELMNYLNQDNKS